MARTKVKTVVRSVVDEYGLEMHGSEIAIKSLQSVTSMAANACACVVTSPSLEGPWVLSFAEETQRQFIEAVNRAELEYCRRVDVTMAASTTDAAPPIAIAADLDMQVTAIPRDVFEYQTLEELRSRLRDFEEALGGDPPNLEGCCRHSRLIRCTLVSLYAIDFDNFQPLCARALQLLEKAVAVDCDPQNTPYIENMTRRLGRLELVHRLVSTGYSLDDARLVNLVDELDIQADRIVDIAGNLFCRTGSALEELAAKLRSAVSDTSRTQARSGESITPSQQK